MIDSWFWFTNSAAILKADLIASTDQLWHFGLAPIDSIKIGIQIKEVIFYPIWKAGAEVRRSSQAASTQCQINSNLHRIRGWELTPIGEWSCPPPEAYNTNSI